MRETIQEDNAFVIKENGQMIAEVTFKPAGEGTLVIDHTYVAEEMRGQKLAEELIRRVVEHARETHNRIIPACSYADAQFRRRKEYEDVWQRS
ncbi:GNAT family N-acetyltransferase [Paenibacillus sp. YPG26]|uniref:GNAT family N-acetyltransferase n=1 Tax=Paenibacillus sp. YPG26 TaxID=2878915 RepID=UPI00203F3A05|nr:GNAT family N-acetyltransferase [Paenibacillus sp. YPG26]USB31743.1 N-acetyltransferase [Paenibacillus sp. YPG26]